jgi:hypothetical protein
MLKASWRRSHVERSTDPISKLARDMDLPLKLARRHAEIALATSFLSQLAGSGSVETAQVRQLDVAV